MGCKYVKEFTFGGGVGESAKYVKGYYRGGKVGMAEGGAADLKQDKAMIKAAVHKHEKAMHPGQPMTKLARGGQPDMIKPVKPAMGYKAPAVKRAATKAVPVAPQAPLLAMKRGGRTCG